MPGVHERVSSATSLQDQPGESGEAPRPSSVALAVRLMYTGAALALLNVVLPFVLSDMERAATVERLRADGGNPSTAQIDSLLRSSLMLATAIGVLWLVTWLLMALCNGKGMGWARILASLLGVLNVISTVAGLVTSHSLNATVVIPVVSALLAVVIVVLLWRRESSQWFTERSGRSF